MAMSAQLLGKAIADCIVDADAPADSKQKIESLWTNIAGEIINHITANAEISVTVSAGIPVSTTGTQAAQTGATTGPGTGSATIA